MLRYGFLNNTVCLLLCSTAVWLQRESNRRYALTNRNGRTGATREHLERLRGLDKKSAQIYFNTLKPRDKLDIVRQLHLRRTKRRNDRVSAKLPKYYSKLFEKWYIFREEDVFEESTLGRGPGGQATNRRMQTVILRHGPTGLIVKFSRFPSLHLNRRAARELLNVRLEEKILGEESMLGRRKAFFKRRRLRKVRVMKYLTKKGDHLNTTCDARLRYEFHKNKVCLPESALKEMSMPLSSSISMRTILEKECKHLWPLIIECYKNTRNNDEDPLSPKNVPELLQFLFPTFECAGEKKKESSRYLRLSKDDAEVRENVEKMFSCVIETFGLCIKEKRAQDGQLMYAIGKDGQNWLENSNRMITPEGYLTPIAYTVWAHVYRSLHQLELTRQEQLVYQFFKRAAKKERWCEQGLDLILLQKRIEIS